MCITLTSLLQKLIGFINTFRSPTIPIPDTRGETAVSWLYGASRRHKQPKRDSVVLPAPDALTAGTLELGYGSQLSAAKTVVSNAKP